MKYSATSMVSVCTIQASLLQMCPCGWAIWGACASILHDVFQISALPVRPTGLGFRIVCLPLLVSVFTKKNRIYERLRLWIGCSFCCFRQVPSVMRSISSSMSAELSSAKDSSAWSWHIQVQVPQESAISSIACRKVWYALLVFFSYFHGPPSVNAFWQEVQVWSVG